MNVFPFFFPIIVTVTGESKLILGVGGGGNLVRFCSTVLYFAMGLSFKEIISKIYFLVILAS